MLEASAFQALQVWAPYRGRNKPPVELVVRDLAGYKNQRVKIKEQFVGDKKAFGHKITIIIWEVVLWF